MEQRAQTILLFVRMLLIFLFVSVSPNSGHAEQIVLNAGLPAFPPFAYPASDGKKPGTVVSLYRMLEKETGVIFKIHFFPYARTLTSLKNGTLDVAIMFKNHSVQGDVSYIGKVSQSKVIVLSTKGNKIQRYEDLYQFRRIASIRKASYEPRFDLDTNINKFPVGNYLQSIEMLKLGRVDAAVGSQSGLQNAIDVQGIDTTNWPAPFELGKKEWWLHFSKNSKHHDLIPSLTHAVETLYKSDLIYELYKQQTAAQNNS
ncbi:MAG: transporter substrate-binding domain-containing protein [Sneathiella sp.]|nr:transporter substrate-binding domain-containing protein [Sneathiella sp.]